MQASLYRTILTAQAAKDIPKARSPPNEGSSPHVCRERFFFLVLKKLRTFSKISIQSSVLGTKRYRSLGKWFSFSLYLHKQRQACLQSLKQSQAHVIPLEISGDSLIQEVS